MTPAARLGAAIDILDRVLSGAAAEQALTSWARASRFAGSGDRAAIRDHVYDALRCLRSFTAMAGAHTPSGRALILGSLRAAGQEPDEFFTGEAYAPLPLSQTERNALSVAPEAGALPEAVALDCPDWLMVPLKDALGENFTHVLQAFRERAPVFLRVNSARTDVPAAIEALADDGVEAQPHPLTQTAIEVIGGARRIRNSAAYLSGLVELQDASPQAAVAALPLRRGMKVLDFCAGGGGKTLAMAALCDADYTAHDVAPQRMRDLPERARRAGVAVSIRNGKALIGQRFDLVLLDVPCSGSGTWRRAPDAKWTLTPDRLSDLVKVQAEILDGAVDIVAPSGAIAYMTCSLLDAENREQIDAFIARNPGWHCCAERMFTPIDGGDGFYSALLTRE